MAAGPELPSALWPGCSPEETSSPAASYLGLAVTLKAQGTEVSKEGDPGDSLKSWVSNTHPSPFSPHREFTTWPSPMLWSQTRLPSHPSPKPGSPDPLHVPCKGALRVHRRVGLRALQPGCCDRPGPAEVDGDSAPPGSAMEGCTPLPAAPLKTLLTSRRGRLPPSLPPGFFPGRAAGPGHGNRGLVQPAQGP